LCDRLESGAPVSAVDERLLRRALSLRRHAAALRRPPVVALVGPPNTGKSTLFNALLGHARALTSAAAGTTRDFVEEQLLLAGVPVRLRDTAGGEGGRRVAEAADLVIRFLSAPDEAVAPEPSGPAERLVLGRVDLQAGGSPAGVLGVSGRTGQGMAPLIERMAEDLGIPPEIEADVWAPWNPVIERRLSRRAALLPD